MKKKSLSIISTFFLLVSIVFSTGHLVKAEAIDTNSTINTSISFYIIDPTSKEFPDKSWIQLQNLSNNTIFGEEYNHGRIFTTFQPGKYKFISIGLRDANSQPVKDYPLEGTFEVMSPPNDSGTIKAQAKEPTQPSTPGNNIQGIKVMFYITDTTGAELPSSSWMQIQNLSNNSVFGEQYDQGKVFTNFQPGKYKLLSISLRDSTGNPIKDYKLDRTFEVPTSSTEPLKIQATTIPQQDSGTQSGVKVMFYITDTTGAELPNSSWMQIQNLSNNSVFGEQYDQGKVFTNFQPGKYKLLSISLRDSNGKPIKDYKLDRTFEVPASSTDPLKIQATAIPQQDPGTQSDPTDISKIAVVSASNVNALQNSTASIDIIVENVQGFSGANFDINYDPTIAVCTKSNLGDFLKEFIITPNLNEAANGKVKIALAGTSGVNGKGTIVKLKFDVKGTNNSKTSIKISNLSLNNIDGKDITAKSIDGSLKIGDTVQYGDVNGDGKITAADVTLILRHAAGLSTISDDKINAADVNGDGKVNSGDATLVLRYIAELIKDFPVQNTRQI